MEHLEPRLKIHTYATGDNNRPVLLKCPQKVGQVKHYHYHVVLTAEGWKD